MQPAHPSRNPVEPPGPARAPGYARTWALGAIAGSAAAIGVAYAAAFLPGGLPRWAPWLFMAGTSIIMISTMILGAARNGRIGWLWIPFLLVLVILLGGFGVVLALPPADPGDPELWLGLPPRAAVVLYGIGFLPLLLVPVAYAWTFDHLTLEPGDLERIRDEAIRARGDMPLGWNDPAIGRRPTDPSPTGSLPDRPLHPSPTESRPDRPPDHSERE